MVDKKYLTYEQFLMYDRFFQYGNLAEAKYVFVGLEEGLNEQDIENNHYYRAQWTSCIPENIKSINKIDNDWGYYIDDCKKADWIRTGRMESGETFDEFSNSYWKLHSRSALSGQARVMALLNINKYPIKQQEILTYTKDYLVNMLHTPQGETAMVDFYGLPKQGKRRLCSEDSEQQSNRLINFKRLYEIYPMTVSIVYFSNKKARKELPYMEMGFEFRRVNTGVVSEKFKELVKPSTCVKEIIIGERVRKLDNHRQWVFIVPYLRNGAMSNNDLAVLATWIPRL